ncbi:adenosylcobinamide-phosphate synthase CbiB [Peptoclostridium acidaminophilum]|nr:adenosylcobinamide-phosphate synthase CbiB [Peptoclostridium acidaminophilum]
MALAVALDFLLGDPHSWPHPIIFIGRMIGRYEKLIRRQTWVSLRLGGFFLAGLSVAMVAATVSLILHVAGLVSPWLEFGISAYLIYTSLAAKCLRDEAIKVYDSLKSSGIDESRRLLSYLVGRDTQSLDEKGVARAVVETVAENTIDGVLAPMLYLLLGFLFGFPVQAVFIYKTVNTLDSMVGYIQEPYREIGFASAKLDDLLNYMPARMGSVVMLLSGLLLGYDFKNGARILIRDRKNHKSPNCAYPEAAAAGLLGIRLGGTNTYFGQTLVKPTIGDAERDIEPEDIMRTCNIMYASQAIASVLCIAALIFVK